jgi:hypothetical protein
VEPVLRAVRLVRPSRRGERPSVKPRQIIGDKRYSYRTMRGYLRRRGTRGVIPTRKDQRSNPQSDKEVYRRRNIIERAISWLKENPRLISR